MICLITPSGTSSRRAAFTSRLRTGFFSIMKQSSPEPSQLRQAFRIAFRWRLTTLEPVASAATLRSSLTFQSMNDSMSGWSASTTTIFAARRVVPPDLLALAAQQREVRSCAGAIFEQARLPHPKIHDPAFVDEIVGDRLDEAGVRLRMLVGGGRLGQLAGLVIDL